jgi:hypothetical protein
MINDEIEKKYKKVLNMAIALGILTQEEYEAKWKGKYVDPVLGTDSFMGYLEAVIRGSENHFSLNEKMIKDAKKLEKRFGLKIN